MLNPFKYGEIVSGSNFIDREDETKKLLRDMGNGLKCFLISPRRYGKTSLIRTIIDKLKRKGYLVAFIDLYGVASLEQMAVVLSRAYAEAQETKLDNIWRFIREVIPRLRPVFSVEPDGNFSVTIDVKEKKEEINNTLMHLYNLPYKISKKSHKSFIVIYDEFQEILNLGGISMEKQIRSVIQTHKGIGYLFSGSKKSLMQEMISSKERAFYKMGPVYFLEKIYKEHWTTYIKKNFQKAGFKFIPETIDFIIECAENTPYYIQYLCYEVWDLSLNDKTVNRKKVEQAITSIVCKQSPLYAGWWDLLTLPQKQILQMVSVVGGKNIFSTNFLTQCKLTPATVQKGVKLLQGKEILEKENDEYVFSDIWFKEWIRKV